MFSPNLACVILLSTGTDLYGQPLPATAVKERCAIVKMMVRDEKSAVRADTSASRGNAHEIETSAVILLTATTTARIHDIIEVAGQTLKITAKFPRYNIIGTLDHYQIEATIWS
jgi:hypothetical protein